MNSESLARLKRNLAAATDDVLVALANKGLVRRAAKDLEKGPPPTVELAEQYLLVTGEGWTVTMPPDGPTAATDDTAASGITRQILHATMFLRDEWLTGEEEPESTDTLAETAVPDTDPALEQAAGRLAEASTAELFKWAGKTPLLEAAAAFRPTATIEFAPQLSIVFPEADVRVLLMTDRPAGTISKLLGQFKSTAPKSEHPRWVMQAVLALKARAGKSLQVDSDGGTELTAAIREDRAKVARSAIRLLSSVAATGIAHPSTRIIERFQTASVAADAARFPRLSRLLNSVADDARLQIARDAGADPNRMMQRMMTAFALAQAASRPENAERVDLFGRSRSHYVPVASLELHGVGSYGWRTASGYEGLTTLFWDGAAQRFLTATAARGEGQDRNFSLHQAYEEGMGWSGGAAVREMCRRSIRLTDAKVNAEGRLSSTENCRVELGEPCQPGKLDFAGHAIDQWDQLGEVARRSQPMGLRIPDSRQAFVVLRPEEWGERWFDELDQAFVWRLLDCHGAPLELRVPWTPTDENGIAFLESLKVDRDQLTAVLGRLELLQGRLFVYPFALFSESTIQGDTVLCPQFDQDRLRSRNESLLQRLRAKYNRQKQVETRLGDKNDEERYDDETLDAPLLFQRLYLDLERILVAALESGATTLAPSAESALRILREQCESLALKPIAEPIAAVLESKSQSLPAAILSAAYRLQLYRQALRLSHLTA